MSDIIMEGSDIIFVDYYSDRKKIINIGNCLYNKSSIPFHLIDNKGMVNTLNEYVFCGKCMNVLNKGFDIYKYSEKCDLDYISLVIYLTAAHLTHITHPAKIAMFNCDSPLIYNILSITGIYNSDSQAVIIENEISDNGDNSYLEAISMAETPPDISLCVSDYNNTNLQSDVFDTVIVNGSILTENIEAKIDEAERIFKNSGIMLYILENQPDVEILLNQKFPDYEEYIVSETMKILKINSKSDIKKEPSLKEKYSFLQFIDDIFSVDFIRKTVKKSKLI